MEKVFFERKLLCYKNFLKFDASQLLFHFPKKIELLSKSGIYRGKLGKVYPTIGLIIVVSIIYEPEFWVYFGQISLIFFASFCSKIESVDIDSRTNKISQKYLANFE